MTYRQDISVEEALALILDNVPILPAEDVPLMASLRRVLAKPVVAREELPPFANSSMDGFALRAVDIQTAAAKSPVTLKVVGEIAAGGSPGATVEPGSGVRIMTGAPMPSGADCVVPVEDTGESRNRVLQPPPAHIKVFRALGSGDYVRPAGEDVQVGSVVLSAGTKIRPQEIGLLASLGSASVSVVRQPRVGVLATGDELLAVEQPLEAGKIRNSNSYVQASQVIEAGGVPISLGVARDSLGDLRERLQEGLSRGVDLFVSSAGVSVGAYDVVKHLLDSEGMVRFWRVRMRPGKPLTFGEFSKVPYLGLPGNPVSAMVSFERFTRPALLKMGGHSELARPQLLVTVETEMHSDGRESYVRALARKTDHGYVATLTGSQGSHMMTSLSKANALVIIPEGMEFVPAGARLMALMLDWPASVF